jgi:plasmid maintenance system antidote protein VapI
MKNLIIWRKENKYWLKKSTDFSLILLDALDELGWDKKTLSEKIGVSIEEVDKYVNGKENLKLDTISKLQKTLGIIFINS